MDVLASRVVILRAVVVIGNTSATTAEAQSLKTIGAGFILIETPAAMLRQWPGLLMEAVRATVALPLVRTLSCKNETRKFS